MARKTVAKDALKAKSASKSISGKKSIDAKAGGSKSSSTAKSASKSSAAPKSKPRQGSDKKSKSASEEIPACLRGFGPPNLQPARPKRTLTAKPYFLPTREEYQWKKPIVTISFFDPASSGIAGIAEEVMKIASKWTDDILLKFVRSRDNDPSADIRVSFQGRGQFFSLIGSQSKQGTTPSMNLGFRPGDPSWEMPEERRRLILHEFGHALGLHHEHKHPSMGLNMSRVIEFYSPKLPGYGPAQIQQQFITLSESEIDPRFKEFSKVPDPDSIMMYEIPPGMSSAFPQGLKGGYDLSAKDREGIVKLYASDAKFAPGPQGLEIKVGDPAKLAYWLFGKDKGLFHVRIDTPGDYEILVSSETLMDNPKILDPFARVPLPYNPNPDIFKLGTHFEIFEPDAKSPNSKAKTPISGQGFTVQIPDVITPGTDLTVFSKVVRFEKKGLYFLEVTNETADILKNDVSRFILQIRRK